MQFLMMSVNYKMKSIVYASVLSLFLIILFASFSFVIVESKPGEVDEVVAEVLWFDDFEDKTMKWLGVGSGSVTRSEFMAFNGSGSMNVTAQTLNLEESFYPQFVQRYTTLSFFWIVCKIQFNKKLRGPISR